MGEKVIIHAGCWLGVIDETVGSGSIKITIGSGTAIGMGATISAAQRVVLGKKVLLARNVYISDHGHAFQDVSRPIMDQGITAPLPVSIGDHTWLGQNVVVLPGSIIGAHCVIGANSVVRGEIPAFTVAVGTPARVVKRYDKETGIWEKETDRLLNTLPEEIPQTSNLRENSIS